MPLTFPQFQDLPVELQLYIVQYAWETTLHNRHTRLVIAFDTSGPHLTKRGPHDLMSVNPFFRKEIMRFEQNNFVHAFPGSTVYFDTDTDTLELDFQHAKHPIAHYLAQVCEPFRYNIHKLRLVYAESAYRDLERARYRRSTAKIMNDVAASFLNCLDVQVIGVSDAVSAGQRYVIRERAHEPIISFAWPQRRSMLLMKRWSWGLGICAD